jgi:hypothetical protein|tara:strand:- start:55 stop:405 length:351 start_codon:yes stop_codon:yes gene_type:complete
MNRKWINRKVVFEWDGEKYVEIYADKYLYEGEIQYAANYTPGNGGGGGGGGGGNGGVIVLITSHLSKTAIDAGAVTVSAAAGAAGASGAVGTGGGGGNNGVAGGVGAAGTTITVYV